MSDLISRQMLLEYILGDPVGRLLCDKYNLDGLIKQFPSAQPERCEDCRNFNKARLLIPQPDYDLSGYSGRLWKAAYERGKAEAQRTGRWTVEDCHAATYKYCCSNCKAHHRARYDFCPSCGARMEVE